MAAPAVTAGSLQFGRVFAATFGVIGRNWPTLTVLSLLFGVLPDAVIARAHVWLALPKTPLNMFLTGLLEVAAQVLPYSLLAGAVSFVVAGDVAGRRASLGGALAQTATALPRLVVTNLILMLGVIVGLILLIVPGIVAALAWSAALPASALERRWGWGALKRSWELTGTHRGEIFGINLAYGIIFAIIGYCAGMEVKALGFDAQPYDWPIIAAQAAVGLISVPFGMTVAAVLYFELRRLKDGLLPAEASVFD